MDSSTSALAKYESCARKHSNTAGDGSQEPPAWFSYWCRFSFHYVYTAKQTHRSLCTHQADASNTWLGHRTLAHLWGLLPEEEIQLVVISLGAVRDEVYVDESGIWGQKMWRRKMKQKKHLVGISINYQHFLFIICWWILNMPNHRDLYICNPAWTVCRKITSAYL